MNGHADAFMIALYLAGHSLAAMDEILTNYAKACILSGYTGGHA